MTRPAKSPAVRLTDVQRAALAYVAEHDGVSTLATFSDRTVAALVERGFIVGRARSKYTPTRYTTTREGRVALARSLNVKAKAVRRG